MSGETVRLECVRRLEARPRTIECAFLMALLGSAVTLVLGCARGPALQGAGARESSGQTRPSPAVRLGEILLSDDFDNPAAARLPREADDPLVDQGYVGGEYLIRLSPFLQQVSRLAGPRAPFANAQIAVDARLVGGVEARWVGVACRLSMNAGRLPGYYILGVAPATARFAVERHDPDRRTELVPFQSSTAIRRGNASNRLELTCAGSTITARINGTEVGSARDSTYDSGLVMIVAGRSGSIGVEARFDNLVVREAPGEP